MRGEDYKKSVLRKLNKETPPRAWGRHLSPRARKILKGNTPTCVGKTRTSPRPQASSRKHPHVRGEDSPEHSGANPEIETPPRAWGRRVRDDQVGNEKETPPRAWGRRLSPEARRRVLGKHPHVRGEDPHRSAFSPPSSETPPRAWGRLVHELAHRCPCGNTPTCVGKTLRDYSLFLLSRQNNIETSSFSDTSCSPDNSMSWRFGSPMP